MTMSNFLRLVQDAACKSNGGYGYEPYLGFRGKFEDVSGMADKCEKGATEPASSGR